MSMRGNPAAVLNSRSSTVMWENSAFTPTDPGLFLATSDGPRQGEFFAGLYHTEAVERLWNIPPASQKS